MVHRLNRQISVVWLWLVLIAGLPVFLGACLRLAERLSWGSVTSMLELAIRLYYAPLAWLPFGSAGLGGGLPVTYADLIVGAAAYGAAVLLVGVVLSISRQKMRKVLRAG